jgi:hypothetical protein
MGAWLIVRGIDATTQAQTNTAYAWKTISANTTTLAAGHQWTGAIHDERSSWGSLLSIAGDTVHRLQSTPGQVTTTTWYLADAPITNLWQSHSRVLLRLNDNSYRILTAEGELLWKGPGTEAHILRRDAWLIGTATEYTLHHLTWQASLPSTTIVKISIPKDNWHFRLANNNLRLLARRGPRWFLCDPDTGAVLDQFQPDPVLPNQRAPYVATVGNPVGDYQIDGARLRPKDAFRTEASLTDQAIRDAATLGDGRLIAIDIDGRIWQEKRPNSNDMRFMPEMPQSGHALRQWSGGLAIVDQRNQLVFAVDQRGKISKKTPGAQDITPIDHGKWDIRHLSYLIAPKKNRFYWDEAAVGFRPQELTAAPRGLLVRTPNVAFMLSSRFVSKVSRE